MKTGIELISKEREEQLEKHGYTSESDSKYKEEQLVNFATSLLQNKRDLYPFNVIFWPHIEKKSQIEKLAIAGALIAAEIDRLQYVRKIEIAKRLMYEIQYDNGAVDRWNPEQYPIMWVNKIGEVAGEFFEKYPELYTEEHISNICCGEEEENRQLYAKLEGYAELNTILGDYFEDM